MIMELDKHLLWVIVYCIYDLYCFYSFYFLLGWTTWCTDNGLIPCENDFCNETEIRSIALAMSTNGMKELGYNYINLDDCWAG